MFLAGATIRSLCIRLSLPSHRLELCSEHDVEKNVGISRIP